MIDKIFDLLTVLFMLLVSMVFMALPFVFIAYLVKHVI